MNTKEKISFLLRAYKYNTISTEETIDRLLDIVKEQRMDYLFYGMCIGMVLTELFVYFYQMFT